MLQAEAAIRPTTRRKRFSSVNKAGVASAVSTSMVARRSGIGHQRQVDQRLDRARSRAAPATDHNSRRTFSSVACSGHCAVHAPEIVQAHRNGAVALIQGRVEIEAHAGDGSGVDDGLCAARQRRRRSSATPNFRSDTRIRQIKREIESRAGSAAPIHFPPAARGRR